MPRRDSHGRFLPRAASRAITTVRAMRPIIIRAGQTQARHFHRRRRASGGFTLSGLGSGFRGWTKPLLGSFAGGKLAGGPFASMAWFEDLRAKFGLKLATAIVMYLGGHLLKWGWLKEGALGPASAAIWDLGEHGTMSGDED